MAKTNEKDDMCQMNQKKKFILKLFSSDRHVLGVRYERTLNDLHINCAERETLCNRLYLLSSHHWLWDAHKVLAFNPEWFSDMRLIWVKNNLSHDVVLLATHHRSTTILNLLHDGAHASSDSVNIVCHHRTGCLPQNGSRGCITGISEIYSVC